MPTAFARTSCGRYLFHVYIRALIHLLFTAAPQLRRPPSPTALVARALELPLAPDRLRLLRGTVWIAETRHIPTSAKSR